MKLALKTGVAFTVIFCHCLLLALMSFQHTPKIFTPPAAKKMAVQTIQLSPKKRSPSVTVKPAAPKPVNQEVAKQETPPQEKSLKEPQPLESPAEATPPAPLPAPQAAPKPEPSYEPKEANPEVIKDKQKESKPAPLHQTVPKKETPAARTAKPKPAIKRPSASASKPQRGPQPTQMGKTKAVASQAAKSSETQRLREERLQRARQSLANIDKNSDKTKSSGTVQRSTTASRAPTAFPLQIDHEIDTIIDGKEESTSGAEEYRSEMAQRLKLLLCLPEYGDVKVKLTLNRSGKVMRVFVIHSENAKNRDYVVKALKEMVFPGFGIHFNGEAEHTFTLTLSNDI